MGAARGIIQSNGQPLLKTSPFPGGQGGSVTPQKDPSTGGKGGGAVQPGAPIGEPDGTVIGNGILPPGSVSTADMGMDGMSTTERNFIAKHGKKFSEMTPEEQFAVQNPVSAPMAPRIPPPMMPQPLPAPGGFDVNQASATGLQNSMGATTNLLNSPINQGAYANAATRGLGQSMGATANIMAAPLNVDQFNNPYQQQVVDNVQQDIERQRQMATNNLGAQAQSAGAFGGSRQAVAEGVTNAEYGRMAANALAPLRVQGYNTSMANAMADRAARLGAAGQQGNLANSLLGNVFSARGQQMGAAGQLSNQANQAFNTGRTINQDMMQQGLLQQSLQQALLDSAATDMSNYANAPTNSLGAPLAALGAANMGQQTQTSQQNPGILGVLGALKYMNFF